MVQRAIPPERVRGYLRDLDRQLQVVILSAPGDEGLAGRAHKLISQAGMLGLIRMMECARALEHACLAGSGQAAALRNCRTAAGDIERYAIPAVALYPIDCGAAPQSDREAYS